MLKIGYPSQVGASAGESRCAITPDVVKKLARLGSEISAERGLGRAAGFEDSAFTDAGVHMTDHAASLWSDSDVVVVLQPPSVDQVARMRRGSVLIGHLRIAAEQEVARAAVAGGVTVLSLELVPRITRAQAVDILSAMASLAGYKGVLLGAGHCAKMFPMMVTAAGTLTASKVFIIGAGVAGLAAIATARRLGGVVEAFDTRPAVKEQVESLGARFVQFDVAAREGKGGYAADQTAEEQARQRELMGNVIAASDVVITTAAIPGRPAPRLIDESVVRRMKQGSVIVDLAADSGGNCTLTEPGSVVIRHGVTIVGLRNIATTIPNHASQMYARVIVTLLSWMVKEGELRLDFEDEVIAAMTAIHDGHVRLPVLRTAMGLPESAGQVQEVKS